MSKTKYLAAHEQKALASYKRLAKRAGIALDLTPQKKHDAELEAERKRVRKLQEMRDLPT